MAPWEHFEHTADLGLRVRAPDLDTLFRDAGAGLVAMVVEDLAPDESDPALEFRVAGGQTDYLLFDWLNELLCLIDARRVLPYRFRVRVDETGLCGSACGQPMDPARHRLTREVKAITYHVLRVERLGDGWLAEVIVDI